MVSQPEKKLVYVLNYVHQNDVQHFVHVMGLLNALKARGWSIVLLSEKGGSGTATVLGQEVRYLSQSSKLLRFVRLLANLIGLRAQGYRLVFVRISKLPALIAAVLGKFIGMKVVYWQSGTNRDLDQTKPLNRRIVENVQMKSLITAVNRFVTGPETMLDYYEREYGVPRRKLLLLYNDIDITRFPTVERVRKEGDPIRILFVHSFSPSKNVILYLPQMIDRLNRAAQAGAKIVFDLAGDGPERKEVEAIVAKAGPGVTVRLLGAVRNTSLPQHYAEADIFVMPSYREGMPRALMEAMSSGLPAVSTDAGGTRDLVGPLQDGFVVSRDDPEKFADCLYTLVVDPELRRAMGTENLQSIRRFSTDVVADMYDDRLSSLLR